jgi:hypothetical protein
MVRNLAGLKSSAQSRSNETMSRATLAVRQMKSEEVDINFRSVATRAGVSPATAGEVVLAFMILSRIGFV